MPIEVKNVSFAYPNGFVAIEDLDLTINDGEKVAIVGQNGAGKTTAVKMLNGLYKPSKGDVLIDGVNTKQRTTAQIARTVGYVFQNPDDQIFNSKVSVEIEYMPRYFKLPENEIKARVDYAVELTAIGKFLKRNPYDIPFPIRKFVTIASVLVTQPKYLILDEPTAGQDQRGIALLSHLVDQLQAEGKTVLTITHDMEFAVMNFNRIIVMAHKNIIADGSAKDVFWNEEIITDARIKKPVIGELAKRLALGNKILFCDELVNQL
jgi:energy-coupling factor transport system ATP-binding protein